MIRTLLLLFFSLNVHALTLEPLPEAPTDRLPINKEDGSNYACAEIADRLVDYNNMARSHDQSVSGFLSQVVERVMNWYSLLQPLEGTTQAIPADTFQPLQSGAEQISNITNLAFDNSELLANELDRIIVSLRQCQFK
ncbi:MAG: hypothetical protein KF799_06555 [Bdellovibrionales bacterium]|nr:hypothetical protein [Bdellovibrionales bacterium]